MFSRLAFTAVSVLILFTLFIIPVSAQELIDLDNLEPLTSNNVSNLELLLELEPEPGTRYGFAYSVDFDPQSGLIAVARGTAIEDDLHVRLVDLNTGDVVAEYPTVGPPNSVKFSPDGKMVAVSGRGFTQFLDVETGDELKNLGEGTVIFIPDGRTLFVMWDAPNIVISDLESGEIIASLEQSAEFEKRWTVSASGEYVLSNDNEVLKFWRVETGELVFEYPSQDRVVGMCISPDDSLAAFGTFRNKVVVLDTATGDIVYVLEGNSGFIPKSFNFDGSLLFTGEYEKFGEVGLWDMATGEKLNAIIPHAQLGDDVQIYVAKTSSDGKLLFTSASDPWRQIKVWGVKTGE